MSGLRLSASLLFTTAMADNVVVRALLRRPLLTGVVCAGTKGAMADVTSQLVLQQRERLDTKQTVAFGLWNAVYCGGCVYLLYSVVLPRFWPVTLPGGGGRHPRFVRNVVSLVAFDNFVATPLLCLPTYYLALGALEARWQDLRRPLGLVSSAMRRYASEFRDVMGLSWSMWVPIHLATFSVVPVPLRTHFTAAMSFLTLTLMSALQSQLERRRPAAGNLCAQPAPEAAPELTAGKMRS